MEIIKFTLEKIPSLPKKSALCLGYFDGVHLAHQALISEAKKTGLPVAVLTFSDSDNVLINRRKNVLTTFVDKAEILEKFGVDYLLVVPFDQALMSLTPDKFISKLLNNFNIGYAICGFDYTFGAKAAGRATDLVNSEIANFTTIVVEKMATTDEQIISTTLIKEKIVSGAIGIANSLLGYHYAITGKVVKGHGNGRKLGFPTANIEPSANYVIPKNGVYAATLEVNGKTYLGMSSVGTHPTIDEVDHRVIEIHLFDFNEDLYGKDVKISFLRFERDERKFTSVDELIKQMQSDEKTIRTDFS